jgi:hypothetical protein
LREDKKLRKLLVETNGQESEMDFAQIVDNVTGFLQSHLLISIAALAVVVYFFFTNPKESFKILLIVAILAVAGYLVMQLGSSTESGVSEKKEMIYKTKNAIGE